MFPIHLKLILVSVALMLLTLPATQAKLITATQLASEYDAEIAVPLRVKTFYDLFLEYVFAPFESKQTVESKSQVVQEDQTKPQLEATTQNLSPQLVPSTQPAFSRDMPIKGKPGPPIIGSIPFAPHVLSKEEEEEEDAEMDAENEQEIDEEVVDEDGVWQLKKPEMRYNHYHGTKASNKHLHAHGHEHNRHGAGSSEDHSNSVPIASFVSRHPHSPHAPHKHHPHHDHSSFGPFLDDHSLPPALIDLKPSVPTLEKETSKHPVAVPHKHSKHPVKNSKKPNPAPFAAKPPPTVAKPPPTVAKPPVDAPSESGKHPTKL